MAIEDLRNLEAAAEGSIYIYTDEARRRKPKIKSREERRREAYDRQRASGIRIRIARPVANTEDFREELNCWAPYIERRDDGTRLAHRKGVGALTMTVFDTMQQPIKNCEDLSREELEDRFRSQYPMLFDKTPPIKVAGVGFFGNEEEPFLGLRFLPPTYVHDEQKTVRGIVAPELLLQDDHLNEHRLHVSLGHAMTRSCGLELINVLEPVAPKFVEFKPATIELADLVTGRQI